MSLELLKRGPATDVLLFEQVEDGEDEVFSRIRCPLCQWRPDAASLWCCVSDRTPEPFFHGCGTLWNTFQTGGRCPGCLHQWQWTSCHRCGEWSRHLDWYETSRASD